MSSSEEFVLDHFTQAQHSLIYYEYQAQKYEGNGEVEDTEDSHKGDDDDLTTDIGEEGDKNYYSHESAHSPSPELRAPPLKLLQLSISDSATKLLRHSTVGGESSSGAMKRLSQYSTIGSKTVESSSGAAKRLSHSTPVSKNRESSSGAAKRQNYSAPVSKIGESSSGTAKHLSHSTPFSKTGESSSGTAKRLTYCNSTRQGGNSKKSASAPPATTLNAMKHGFSNVNNVATPTTRLDKTARAGDQSLNEPILEILSQVKKTNERLSHVEKRLQQLEGLILRL